MFPKLTEDDLHRMSKDQLIRLVMAFSGTLARLDDARRAQADEFCTLALKAVEENNAILALLCKEGRAAVGISTNQA